MSDQPQLRVIRVEKAPRASDHGAQGDLVYLVTLSDRSSFEVFRWGEYWRCSAGSGDQYPGQEVYHRYGDTPEAVGLCDQLDAAAAWMDKYKQTEWSRS